MPPSEQDLSRRIKQLFRQPLDELTQQLPEPRSSKTRERVTQNRRTEGKAEPAHPFKIIVESEDYSLKYRPNNRGPDKDLSSSPDYGFYALENLGPGPSDRAIAGADYSGQSMTSLYDFKGQEFSAAIPTGVNFLNYLGYGFSATRGRFTRVSVSQGPDSYTDSNPGANANESRTTTNTREYIFGPSADLIISSGQFYSFTERTITSEGGSLTRYGATDRYSYTTRARSYFTDKGTLVELGQGTFEKSRVDDSTGGSISKVGGSTSVTLPNLYSRHSESGSVVVQLSPSLSLPYTESKLYTSSGVEGGGPGPDTDSESRNQPRSIAVYNYKGVEACFYRVTTFEQTLVLNTATGVYEVVSHASDNQHYLWVNGTIYEVPDRYANGASVNGVYELGLSSLTRDYYTTWVMFNSPRGNKVGTFYKAEPIWKDDDSIVEAKVIVYDLIASGGISLVRRDKEPKYKLKIKPGEYPYAIKFYPQQGTIR